jgi:plastocyanin
MDQTATTDLPPTTGEPPASTGTTLATLGFVMAALGPILMILAGLVFGMDTEDLGFFIIPSVLGLLGAYLVRRRSKVAKAFAILVALAIGMLLFWTAFGLALPSSFFDFVPGILVLPGALLAIGGTIAALVTRGRERGTGAGERRAALAIVTLLGVLGGLSAVLTVTGKDTVPDAVAADADVVVTLQDFEFDETGYDAPAGGTVLVKNDDPFVHNFAVDALGIDVDLGPGDEKIVEIPAGSPGTYVLYCEPHTSDPDDPSEDDMASQLTVG